MTLYFVMFLIPAIIMLTCGQLANKKFIWYMAGFLFTIIIGFRHIVGGDWWNYLGNYENIKYSSFLEVITGEDPGYYLINYLMHELNFGIYGVNFICASIFVYGFLRFARSEYNPWMVLTVAVPYTITVVSMGYTRQAVALGLVLWAMVILKEKNLLKFVLLILFATAFHKSAVVMIGLGFLTQSGGKVLKSIAVLFIGIGIWQIFLSQYQDALWTNYVEAQMQSEGAKIRTFMNFIPAFLLILFRKRWNEVFDDFKFWFVIAILSILSFIFVGMASTAIDRMALYLIPIQFVVFSRLTILMNNIVDGKFINLAIALYYGLVLFVWLNFAGYSYAWIPYQNILFLDLW